MSQATTDRRLVTIALIALGTLLLVPVLIGGGMMGTGSGTMMGGMWGGQAPGWMVLIGAVAWLVVLALIVGAGYLIYRAATGSSAASDPAIEELRAAYARGDLTDEEYERRRDTLRQDS